MAYQVIPVSPYPHIARSQKVWYDQAVTRMGVDK